MVTGPPPAPAAHAAEDAYQDVANPTRPGYRTAAAATAAGPASAARLLAAVGVVLHGVDEGVEFLGVAHVAGVGGALAGGVHAVGEEDDGLAPLDAGEALLDDGVEGVVETRAATGARAADGVAQLAAVARRLGEEADFVVEGDDEDAVFGAELIDEGDGGRLDVFEAELR